MRTSAEAEWLLDDEHRALREMATEVAVRQVAPHATAVDESGEFPERSLAAVAATGLHSIRIPKRYGGQGGATLHPRSLPRRSPACA